MKRALLIILLVLLPYAASYLTALVVISQQTMYVDSTYSIATGFVLFLATPLVAIVGSTFSFITREKHNYTYKSLFGYLFASIILSVVACTYIMSIDLYK